MAGRPDKYTVDYFSHDALASSGRSLTILFNTFGHEGISAWWQLLEILASTTNHFIKFDGKEDIEYLAARMRFDVDRLKKILEKMAFLEAIDSELYERGIIWSQNFVNRLLPVYKTRRQDIPSKPDVKIPTLTRNSISSVNNRISLPTNSIKSTDNTQTKLNYTKGSKGGERGKEDTRPFGELKNVMLTPEEYDKLVSRFGDQGATYWIDELSLAKASKGYKSKSDYATILAWERREKKKSDIDSGPQYTGPSQKPRTARKDLVQWKK